MFLQFEKGGVEEREIKDCFDVFTPSPPSSPTHPGPPPLYLLMHYLNEYEIITKIRMQ